MKKITLIIAVFLFAFGNKSTAQTAKEIAYKVYNKATPKDGESDMTMTLINKKGSERVRKLHQFFIDLGEVEKQLMFFTAPADVKNTAFMNWSYTDADKNDDQWLYLPALKKVKRISSSNKDNEFMGSDFTYEDMEKRNPERDKHELIETTTYNEEKVWVVSATPIEEEQYSKKIAWISQEKNTPLKIEFYDEDEELLKILKITSITKLNNYWIVQDQEMENVQTNHKTQINLTNLQIDKNLSEGKISQRAMQKGL